MKTVGLNEKKVIELIKKYSIELDEHRIREIAREEAEDVIENATIELDNPSISVSV
jgi:hypothetical protein